MRGFAIFHAKAAVAGAEQMGPKPARPLLGPIMGIAKFILFLEKHRLNRICLHSFLNLCIFFWVYIRNELEEHAHFHPYPLTEGLT